MIMFARCPKCGGQLAENRYFGICADFTVDRCISCGWYQTEETSKGCTFSYMMTHAAEVKDDKDGQQNNRWAF